MQRRNFIGASVGAASALTGLAGCNRPVDGPSGAAPSTSDIGTLAGYTLEELRDMYRYDLFDDYLPFIYEHVVDHEYGGFLCNTDRDGSHITTNKRAWYIGRGIWVHSFLYNNFDPDPRYLKAAGDAVNFAMKTMPEGDEFWPAEFTREGTPVGEADVLFYGDIFFANGLQEYARATNDDSYRELAKAVLLKSVRRYDSPDYAPRYNSPALGFVDGPRILGHWMVLLRITSQMLADGDDPELKAINDRAIDAIMNRHFRQDAEIQLEVLNHDFSTPDNGFSQYSAIGHGIETFWMIMHEAVRRKDPALYNLAAKRFKRHVEVAWDDVYGGCFHDLTHIDDNIFVMNKSLWLQEEILLGTLLMIEHTGDTWAQQWFDKMYTYVRDKYTLKQYGFPLWILYADRKVTFERHATRVGNFHHPRHLMLTLLTIDRMIERGGRISGLFR